MSNLFGALEAVLRLSQAAINYLKKWNTKAEIASSISQTSQKVVEILVSVPGITTAHSRNFHRATPLFTLKDKTLVKIFINVARVKHVFLADRNNKMIFGGYVGWIHTKAMNKAIEKIKKEFN